MVISRKEVVTEPSLLVKRVEEKRDSRPSSPAVSEGGGDTADKESAAKTASDTPDKEAAEVPAADVAADDANVKADADTTAGTDVTADANSTTDKPVAPESTA
jgi:hypothetical protein